MKMIERLEAMQKRGEKLREEGGPGSYNENEKIFFDFSEGEHKIRLVGEWVTIRSHWIYPGPFSKVKLFDESAFNGEDRIKKNIVCSDFDTTTEKVKEEKSCILCKLHSAASEILYNTSDLSPEQKSLLSGVIRDTNPMERTFFLCIDRNNPEIAPGKKGLKIIEFPKALMTQWTNLILQNKDLDVCGDDTGIDFIITKKRQGKSTVFTVNYSMKNISVEVTPLTDEEKAFQRHDIRKIMGKIPDHALVLSKLRPEFKDILSDTEIEQMTPVAEDNMVPF